MEPQNTLVVLSGGLDSGVALAQAIEQGSNQTVSAVTFDYGQKHRIELEHAHKLAEVYGVRCVERQVLGISKQGALLDAATPMPQATYEELQEAQGPSPTYVPYRNGTFLSLAASHALEIGAERIVAGMHAEDAHNWAYPDCTPEFIGAMQNAIYIGTYHKVRLECPWTYMTKREIVARGLELSFPFQVTHSCYEGTIPACGVCPTCIGRLEAFKANGVRDPIEYQFDRLRGQS
jgi:7-cyano-7-deazaguanine synthase